MGILAQRLADYEEVRNDAGWLSRDDEMAIGPRTSSGVRVNRQAAIGLTTVWRCVDLISHAVSMAPVDVVVKVGGRSFPEFSPPSWLASPVPTNPNYMTGDYFGDVAVSMLLDGNFFTHVYPHVYDPRVLTVLDPQLVDVKPGPVYVIHDESGRVKSTLGPDEILHGWWFKLPSALRGVSPLEKLRQALGNAIAAEEHAGRFFGQGAALSFGVEVPGMMDNEKRKDFQASLREGYAGNRNSHAIGVLTAGAKFVGGLAPTPEQAQMLATRKFSVEDLARIYGVPAGMAGSQEPGASSYASAVIWRTQFRDDAVLKFTSKIERQHSRLLELPASISAPAEIGLRFNLDWIARTDLLARYQAHSAGVQGGFLTPNEARALEDKAPVDTAAKDPGDMLYMQRQMVPLKDLATSAPIPGAAVDANIPLVKPAARSENEIADERRHVEFVAAMARPEPQIHLHAGATTVLPATVNVPVSLPQSAVNVTNDSTEMADAIRELGPVLTASKVDELRAMQDLASREQPTPVINVAAPVVNLSTPKTQRVEIVASPSRVTKRVVARDTKGQITTVVEQSMDE